MKTFKDTNGKDWSITLTIGSAKRVRDALGVDLLELNKGDPPLLTRLATDVILLIDVIFVLINPQAEDAGITDQQFGESLGGEAAVGAMDAFYEELVLFFQSLARKDMVEAIQIQRRIILKGFETFQRAMVQTGKKIETRIDNLDLEAEIDKALGNVSTNSPESAESIPGP